ncbi:MAG: GGDEF domain-containing protein, partial [Nannocystaceae bacterium]
MSPTPKSAEHPPLARDGVKLLPEGLDAARLAMQDSRPWMVLDHNRVILEVSPSLNELYRVKAGYFEGTPGRQHMNHGDYETNIKPYDWRGEAESSALFRYGPNETLVLARWREYLHRCKCIPRPPGKEACRQCDQDRKVYCYAYHEDLSREQKLIAKVGINPLTGLPNKGETEDTIARRMEVATEPFAIFIGDLDRFKAVNDRYGHAAGDDVL